MGVIYYPLLQEGANNMQLPWRWMLIRLRNGSEMEVAMRGDYVELARSGNRSKFLFRFLILIFIPVHNMS